MNGTANGSVTAKVLSSRVFDGDAVVMMVPPVMGANVPTDCEKV
ncbi:MAG: hypothetical protein ACK595_02605 [Planctomycetota bacterium]